MDYRSGADRGLLFTGGSMLSTPNLLPFLGPIRCYNARFMPDSLPEYIAHYRILRRLGKGGMGEVFLGEDTKQHGRKVALKVLPELIAKDERRLRRFEQEAFAASALNHPNILTVYEFGQLDSVCFMATEYIADTNFKQSLTNFPVNPQESFNKENTTRLFAVIDVPPAQMQLMGEYYLVTNYTYFAGLYNSAQESTLFNVLHVSAAKVIGLSKHWNWYLEGDLQQATGNPPVNLPLILARSRIAYEGNFFKNLFLSTGFEVRYHTPYKADGYSPLTGQFYFQDTTTISNRPDINAFLNFRIKNFKAFIRMENLNSLDPSNGWAFTKYNFLAPNYPAKALWFRLGIWWSFVN